MAGNEAIEDAGRSAARAAWTRGLARVGFGAKALVYAVVATLALGESLGLVGFAPTDTRGAIVRIGDGVAGRGIVVVLAAGFLGLAVWFVVEAAWNPRPSGSAVVGFFSRVGQAAGGLGYLGLAVWTARYALASASTTPSDTVLEHTTAAFLGTPLGRGVVGVAGVVLVTVGVRQVYVGATRAFESWLDLERMRPALRRWGARLGTVGFCTQGLVFAAIGASLLFAAALEQPREVSGFDGVLRAIPELPFGRALLGVAGAGLLAYAAFAVVEAAYKRMNPR